MMDLLATAMERQLLRPLDVQFARMLTDGQPAPVQLAAALVSAAAGAGNVCLPLAELHPETLFDGRDPALARALWELAGLPDSTAWQQILLASPAVSDGHETTPLVLQHQRLYLQRNWLSEVQVAAFFTESHVVDIQPDPLAVRRVLDRLFSPLDAEVDWQKVAAAVALTRRVSVISGGPGTGKTTTVAKLLAAMLLLHQGDKPLRIQLAAPTGKAAARLTESLRSALSKLPLEEAQQRHLPREATTLHRLLGAVPDSQRLRYHQGNPLHLDVLVVDEASMVDLPMMANLVLALPATAQVIFLGDRDQLASVEAGAVLGDICRFAARGYSTQRVEELEQLTGYRLVASSDVSPAVADSLCLLQKSYRFDQHSGIGIVARAVNAGDERQVRLVLQDERDDLHCLPLEQEADYQQMLAQCVAGYRDYLQAVAQGQEAAPVLAAFNRFRLLCALRDGPFGVAGLNVRIEQALQQAGLIHRGRNPANPWYSGRPVMIARNDALLGVFNGDIGIAMPNEAGELRVYFQLPDGQMKPVSPSRLPPHETAYAMTVHKSQGSEFDHTALVLPNGFLPVLTRELVYTAVTRARTQLSLYAEINILCRAVRTPTRRFSGLETRILSGT
ncbi:exodeoxyribonuclease V subunit alpha [Candidatus Symbiopectobacterium sp. NZEC127]|uniref:exodeoxyribonuclease V subunit alpha n=1 Tax=Candidatus Symbiopectobacterium sp. NZEC127 TaxID=2820472 RepID=UPI0022265B3D|nr:exodeoxyribonuclease V subunit alpha [Candidatus Symbiopectobacterium sp. NZEC127]MCW2486883.1 exodeoxyribonuclease V subunit alpha [Candidatus Symbiopectobacterium sp. NZEC127]